MKLGDFMEINLKRFYQSLTEAGDEEFVSLMFYWLFWLEDTWVSSSFSVTPLHHLLLSLFSSFQGH